MKPKQTNSNTRVSGICRLHSRTSNVHIRRRPTDRPQSPGEIKSGEVELDYQESPGEIKSREDALDSQESPGEIKSREVELDSQESPGEIKGRRWSWTLKRVQERSRAGGGAGLSRGYIACDIQ